MNIWKISSFFQSKFSGRKIKDNFFIEIDYVAKQIILHKNLKKALKKSRNYLSAPISIENRKPYIEIPVIIDKVPVNLKLLLDTGLADGLWLFENDSVKCTSNYFN